MNSTPSPTLRDRFRLLRCRLSLPLGWRISGHQEGEYLVESEFSQLRRWIKQQTEVQAILDLLELFPREGRLYEIIADSSPLPAHPALLARYWEKAPYDLPRLLNPLRLTPELAEEVGQRALTALKENASGDSTSPAKPTLRLDTAEKILGHLGRSAHLPRQLEDELFKLLLVGERRGAEPAATLDRSARLVIASWSLSAIQIERLIDSLGSWDSAVTSRLGDLYMPPERARSVLEAAIQVQHPELSTFIDSAIRNVTFMENARCRQTLRHSNHPEAAYRAYPYSESPEEQDRSFVHLASIFPTMAAGLLALDGPGYPLSRVKPETLSLILAGAPAEIRLNIIRHLAALRSSAAEAESAELPEAAPERTSTPTRQR